MFSLEPSFIGLDIPSINFTQEAAVNEMCDLHAVLQEICRLSIVRYKNMDGICTIEFD